MDKHAGYRVSLYWNDPEVCISFPLSMLDMPQCFRPIQGTVLEANVGDPLVDKAMMLDLTEYAAQHWGYPVGMMFSYVGKGPLADAEVN